MIIINLTEIRTRLSDYQFWAIAITLTDIEAYSTLYPQAVTHLGSDRSRHWLMLVIVRELVFQRDLPVTQVILGIVTRQK